MANQSNEPTLFQSDLMALNAALEGASPDVPGAVRPLADVCGQASNELRKLAEGANLGFQSSASAAWGPGDDRDQLGRLASEVGSIEKEMEPEPVLLPKRRPGIERR